MDRRNYKEFMADSGNTAQFRNRQAGWRSVIRTLAAGYAVLVLAKSEITKTFAWGGIYGGTTEIKDVEEGFAEAVASVLLGQSSQ